VSGESKLTSALLRTTDEVEPGQNTAAGLLAVSDLLRSQSLLARRFTDPALRTAGRQAVAAKVFTGKVETAALQVLQAVVAEPYNSGAELCDALDDAAVRLLWRRAAGDSAWVRDDLARLIVAVEGNAELATALNEQSYPVNARIALSARLLGAKANETSKALAELAITRQARGFVRALQHYLDIGADLRNALRATITTAIPLDEPRLAQLVAQLRRIYGAEIDPLLKIDSQVIGGVRAEIAGEVIDGSMATRVAEAKQEIGQQGILV
jgi:F-type H+-transporting ATPase subunit delta